MIQDLDEAMRCASDFLSALEARRLDEAQKFFAPEPTLVFPGGRVLKDVAAIVEGSAGRYRRVAKRIEAVEGFKAASETWVVYCQGTLYGEWPDGSAFAGIRFIDRFEIVRQGIRRQDVWNDAGEARLARVRT